MKSNPRTSQVKSLAELLKNVCPSLLSRRVELDENFCQQARKWPEQVLDFSAYEDLEYIEIKGGGEIRKIKVSQNKKLRSLIIPSQELTGVLDLSNNSELVELNIANNLLNTLKVHGAFSQKLKGIASKYLQPQKHNSAKIHPVRDVTVVLLDMSEPQKTENLPSNKPNRQESDNSTKTTTSSGQSNQDQLIEKDRKISQLENRLRLLEESQNEMVSQREEKIEELENKLLKKEQELAGIKERSEELEKENQSLYQQLVASWGEKIIRQNEELQSLKSSYEAKIDNLTSFLETLLISQAQVKRLGESSLAMSSERQLEKTRQKLLEKLSGEEIDNLCQKQSELTHLEIQREEFETKIEINKY